MWLKGHEKDFLEWVEDILGVVYAYMVFWNSEHLGASGIRLLCLLRFQRTPLKIFQIENHLKDLGPLDPYFPEGLKRPRDWPKATERSWARFLISSPCFFYLSCTCNFHSNAMLRCQHQKKPKNTNTIIKGTGILKHFMICTVALNFYGFYFLTITRLVFLFCFVFVCYISRLYAWHKKWHLISACWVTWVIRELLGTRLCYVGSVKPYCLKHSEQTQTIVHLRCIKLGMAVVT